MFSCLPLHVHFRLGVVLVGEIFYWALLTSLWDPPFRYRVCYRETSLRRGHDYEEERCVALILHLSNIFVKVFFINQLELNSFGDYCLKKSGM